MNATTPVFITANDRSLCSAITAVKNRLVYIAPGITAPIVEAITALMQSENDLAVTIIIDADPEVYRLGYGTEAGLKHLQLLANEQHLPIRYQPGVRIGVLMCDEKMWVYSPTPLLIETGSDRDDQPNAICLSSSAALSAVAHACAAESKNSAETPLFHQAEIGKKVATPNIIEHSLNDLQRQPPKVFDIARIERVYSSKLQYVEFEVKGYRLTTRRVQVPNDLLVGSDKILEARLHNSFALLEGKKTLEVSIPDTDPTTGKTIVDAAGNPVTVKYSEQAIEAERKAIYKDFLIPIVGHGQLINKARRTAFDQRLKWFTARISAYSKAVATALQHNIDESVDNLTTALLPTVSKSPPARLLKHSLNQEHSEDEIRNALKAELQYAFDIADDRFFQPSVKVVYKDLTYETIQNKKFRQQLDVAFKGLSAQSIGNLFNEYDAAPELLN